jgi:hypothetical protein
MKKKKEEKINFVYGVTPEEDAYYKSVVKVKGGDNSLSKSILNVLDGPDQTIERLAFETDPTAYNTYAGIYKQKMRLLPDSVLKRIAIQDSLVSNIVRARQNHVSAFGRPRPDRFSAGYIIRPNAGVTDGMSEDEKIDLAKRIQRAIKLFGTCGHTEGVKEHHQKTFSEYLSLVTRDTQVVGRLATEIVHKSEMGEQKFHYFCHTDAGTIYPAATDNEQAKQAIRDEAFSLIQSVTGRKDLQRENWTKGTEYVWVQVIDGRPFEVFTNKEMKCSNFYPVGNVELDGFPVTPIDTVISAVTTHLNITTHNKVYFESGRATRGMLVIKSDDVNPTLIHNIKQSFNANINGAAKSWRMPVLGFNSDAEVTWQPIDVAGGRDMEFQYLTDLNAREIMTAYMMSPDELPGWSYLSRGTNSQALSEGNQEFKIEAGRDVGIRPLLSNMEEFVNAELFPLIDPELCKICRLVFAGLDADSPEKEIVNIQQNSQVWMTYNDILEKVERKLIPKEYGGEIPLNPSFGKMLDAYLTVGEILEFWFGRVGASKDPMLQYRRDPMYFQNMQLMQAQQQMQMQQEQMQQQAQAQQMPPQDGQSADPNQDQGQAQAQSGPADLARSINQAYELMTKSEANMSPNQRKLLHQQQKTVKWLQKGFEDDVKDTIKEILEVAKQAGPKK